MYNHKHKKNLKNPAYDKCINKTGSEQDQQVCS